jgi:pimeloyl-ACP methyl ester carboxylesterase
MTKLIFKIIDKIAPVLSARMAYRYMSNPRIRKLRDIEEVILQEAKRDSVQFRDFKIQRYSWGIEGRPVILLVHGWEGQAGNFAALISILTEKGYLVIAYDGPSHGRSSKRSTNMFEYADFISQKIKEHLPALIMSHSFGTVTTLLALTRNSQFKLNQWIIITTPFSFKDRIEQIKEQLGVTDRTLRKLINLLEKDTEYTVEELNVATAAIKLTNLGLCTIIHSEHDKVIPIDDARKAHQHIVQSELIELKNLGHYRILWSDELKEIIEKKIEKTAHNTM